ncbi:30S ribosomal protein S10 [Candidatus Parcubacteria bacterium]|nr:30S ribosomal protein S10 [Patescibacteria group bacterium]MBU4482337.1 30S ribosomal protein S10 [Patescibacteria group bacterium]MCG2686521.1 30S ribosomal protein S10 [Candidatus Parcubacteria bacterium]
MSDKIKKDESQNNPDQEYKQRVRIKIRAYDHKVIDQAVRTIIDNVKKTGVEFKGPVPLPTEKKKYTVNRSSFVHKDSREQFEMCIHKRLIDIYNPNAKTIDQLSNLSLPSGVDIEIKM